MNSVCYRSSDRFPIALQASCVYTTQRTTFFQKKVCFKVIFRQYQVFKLYVLFTKEIDSGLNNPCPPPWKIQLFPLVNNIFEVKSVWHRKVKISHLFTCQSTHFAEFRYICCCPNWIFDSPTIKTKIPRTSDACKSGYPEQKVGM